MKTVLISYLIAINIITFIVRGRDKRKATTKKRRISENQLLWLVIFGGGAGTLLGQHLFRHKTIKGTFLRKMYCILVIWIFIIGIYVLMET